MQHSKFFLVLNNHFFFPCPRGRGDFFWKKVANWRSGHRHFVEFFFQKNDLEKKMVFYIRKTKATIWYFRLLCQKSKKKSILKKVGFSLNPLIFKNCLLILFEKQTLIFSYFFCCVLFFSKQFFLYPKLLFFFPETFLLKTVRILELC